MTDEKIMSTIKPDGEYWQPEIETMPREQLEALQVKKLKESINVVLKSPFYKERFGKLGITADSINSLADLRKIPFTTKQDLRDNYPFGLVGRSLDDAVRIHSTSGTTGNPCVVVYSEHDICSWANMIARNLYMVGCRKSDVFQNSSGYGMFTGGLGFQYGAEWLGTMTVPAAAGNSKRQIKFIKDFGTTVVHAIPSYASRIYEVMKEEGVDPARDTKLRVLCIGAEPHSEEQRKRIEHDLHVKAYNSYGISEMMGPGVAFECQEQNGLHIWEDYFIVEIIDPQTLEPVPDGQIGELVLTTINREGMPLLRYRTRDLTAIMSGECACGRTHRRIQRLQGRSDDMIILKGVNIFPIQIEKILLKFKELSSDYLITLDTDNGGDFMTVDVEISQLFTDDYSRLTQLNKEITRQLKDEILVTPKVRLVPKGSLKASDEGKAVRVKDLRKKF